MSWSILHTNNSCEERNWNRWGNPTGLSILRNWRAVTVTYIVCFTKNSWSSVYHTLNNAKQTLNLTYSTDTIITVATPSNRQQAGSAWRFRITKLIKLLNQSSLDWINLFFFLFLAEMSNSGAKRAFTRSGFSMFSSRLSNMVDWLT